MKNIYRLASAIMIIALFTIIIGCGKGTKDTKTTTTEKPTTTEKALQKTTETQNNTASNNTDGTLSYDVVNNTGVTLVDVYVTPAETNNWGKDILPNDVFENGSTIKVTIPPDYGTTCMFDMKITDNHGGHITFTNIDVCRLIKLQINADGTFDYVATK